jgi:hypothetical protein
MKESLPSFALQKYSFQSRLLLFSCLEWKVFRVLCWDCADNKEKGTAKEKKTCQGEAT